MRIDGFNAPYRSPQRVLGNLQQGLKTARDDEHRAGTEAPKADGLQDTPGTARLVLGSLFLRQRCSCSPVVLKEQ